MGTILLSAAMVISFFSTSSLASELEERLECTLYEVDLFKSEKVTQTFSIDLEGLREPTVSSEFPGKVIGVGGTLKIKGKMYPSIRGTVDIVNGEVTYTLLNEPSSNNGTGYPFVLKSSLDLEEYSWESRTMKAQMIFNFGPDQDHHRIALGCKIIEK